MCFADLNSFRVKSIQHNNETGDYILILWRAVGNGNGVYGIRSNAALNDNALYNANDAGNGDDIIWGEPSYYWFIPRHNVFASIKFPSSIADTKLMNSFLKDFMWLHSTLRPKFRETKENSKGGMVIPPFLGAFKSRGHAAFARCCFGV